MLRVKIVAAYVLLLLIFLLGVFLVVRWDFGDIIETNIDSTLRRVSASAEQATKVESHALHAKAQFIASGNSLFRAVSGAKDEEGNVNTDERHLQSHEKLRAQRLRLDDIVDGGAKKQEAAKTPLETGGKQLDIVMVLDDKGVGVAALGKDLFSWFKDDVSKDFPIVKEALKGDWEQPRTDYWMWAFKAGDEKRLYEVSIAPVRRSEAEAPAGVVVVGNMIDDGKAKSKIALLTGEEGAASSSVQLAYFKGNEIVASTFDSSNQQTLAKAISDRDLSEIDSEVYEFVLNEVPYRAVFRKLGQIGDQPYGLIVLEDEATAKRPMDATLTNVIILGILLLFIGAGLFLFLIVRNMKPIEELEAGMHQVIAGNKDFLFEPAKGNQLQSGLAAALNLMSAYLQGKPMPDDDNPSGGWGDMMGDQPQGPGKIQGVALPGMGPKTSPPEEPKE